MKYRIRTDGQWFWLQKHNFWWWDSVDSEGAVPLDDRFRSDYSTEAKAEEKAEKLWGETRFRVRQERTI